MIDLRSQTPKGRRARDRILTAAEALLATRGFHGTSVRDIASAAGLPLATVVYHFAKKEQLHAAVLATIGDELTRAVDQAGDLDGFVTALVGWTSAHPRRVQLLLRELLDNPARVARASQFPLAPFLARASELVATAPAAGSPVLTVLHLVGGISYVVAAWPTVDRIVGRAHARELAAIREADAIQFARRTLGLPTAKDPTHEPRPPASARPSRPRPPRAADHRHRRGPDRAAGQRVRR
jgi:AcrR family transcriptional regulator